MKPKNKAKRLFARTHRNHWLLRGVVLLGLLALSRKTQAQSVIPSAPETPETPPALEPFATTEMDVFVPGGIGPRPGIGTAISL